MQVCVDAQTIAEVIAGWTGIPVGKMVADEIQTVISLNKKLEERVIGQAHALEAIAQRIRTSRANLTDPRKPIGVFLLVGPSGVGKTETALSLADSLYGGERNLITINMSEYQEAHTVSSSALPAGLRRVRRGGGTDGGGPPQAVQRRAARRGREGPPGRDGAVLPGLRQGDPGGRRRAGDRLQEHGDPADLERGHRHPGEALRRPGDRAGAARPSPRRSGPSC